MEVLGSDLARLIHNASLFVNPKSLFLPGEILFECHGGYFTAYSCDDYVSVSDRITNLSGDEDFFILNYKDAEELEKLAKEKESKNYPVTFSFPRNGNIKAISKTGEIELPIGEYREDNWYIIKNLLHAPATPTSYGPDPEFFQPARWSKFSQIKTEPRNAHMGFFPVEISNYLLLRFRLGPTLQGVIKPVDYDKIPEELKFDWMN